MENSMFKIRKSFLIPLSLDVILLFILLLFSLLVGTLPAETVILSIIFIPLFYVFLESFFRTITLGPEGLNVKRFLRSKEIAWTDITNVDAMVVRGKVYVLLTTTKGFHIITNSYENFTELVRIVIQRVEAEKIEERVKEIVEQPVKKIGDIISAWVVAFILLGIIILRLKVGF